MCSREDELKMAFVWLGNLFVCVCVLPFLFCSFGVLISRVDGLVLKTLAFMTKLRVR